MCVMYFLNKILTILLILYITTNVFFFYFIQNNADAIINKNKDKNQYYLSKGTDRQRKLPAKDLTIFLLCVRFSVVYINSQISSLLENRITFISFSFYFFVYWFQMARTFISKFYFSKSLIVISNRRHSDYHLYYFKTKLTDCIINGRLSKNNVLLRAQKLLNLDSQEIIP